MAKKKKNVSKFEFSQKYNRIFSESLKQQIVEQLSRKEISISQVTTLYSVSRTSVYNWIQAYSPEHKSGTKMVVQKESEAAKTAKILQRNAELERAVGQKQLELDYLNKLIELANKELGYDLKKTFVPPQ